MDISCITSKLKGDFIAHIELNNIIVGHWVEDNSTYEIECPTQLRAAIIYILNNANKIQDNDIAQAGNIKNYLSLKMNSVKIGGHIIEVKQQEDTSCELNDKEHHNIGLANYREGLILLSKGLHLGVKQETLCHEILHFMQYFSGMYKYIQDNKLDRETICDLMSNIFYQFLKDNTNFFEKGNL